MESFSKLILDFYDVAQSTDTADFQDEAMRRLKADLSFESAMIGDLGVLGDRLVPTGVYLHNMSTERITDRQRTVGEEILLVNGTVKSRDPALRATFRHRGKSIATDIVNMTDDHNVLAYCRRYETAHSLTYVSDRLVQGRLTAISFWRAQRHNPFRNSTEHFADMALPHLIQARQINHQLNAIQGPPDGAITLLCSTEGRLYFAVEQAISILQEEWPQWSSPFLPPALLTALKSRSSMDYAGKRIYVRAKLDQAVLTLSLTRGGQANHGVTSAEMRCVLLAAQGLQYKEIATRLSISPSTVRNQLSSAYRKLDVKNKTSLVQALTRLGIRV